jgi:hypothetical protein
VSECEEVRGAQLTHVVGHLRADTEGGEGDDLEELQQHSQTNQLSNFVRKCDILSGMNSAAASPPPWQSGNSELARVVPRQRSTPPCIPNCNAHPSRRQALKRGFSTPPRTPTPTAPRSNPPTCATGSTIST